MFIVLNDSASPKMVIKMSFIFFRFLLKVLELFECRRGNLYIYIHTRRNIRFKDESGNNIRDTFRADITHYIKDGIISLILQLGF